MIETQTEAEAYMWVACERYRLMRTHRWDDDVIETIRNNRAARRERDFPEPDPPLTRPRPRPRTAIRPARPHTPTTRLRAHMNSTPTAAGAPEFQPTDAHRRFRRAFPELWTTAPIVDNREGVPRFPHYRRGPTEKALGRPPVDNSVPVDSRFANRSIQAIVDLVAAIPPRRTAGEGNERWATRSGASSPWSRRPGPRWPPVPGSRRRPRAPAGCERGEFCVWPDEDYGGAAVRVALENANPGDCVPLAEGADGRSFANRTKRPVTVYQGRDCSTEGEFDTYPGGGTFVPQAPYVVRGVQIWER